MKQSQHETVTHPPDAHADERGSIVNVTQGVELRHVAVITRARGAVFANHFHPETTQRMYLINGRYRSVSAPVDADGNVIGEIEEFIVKPGDLTEVGPMVGHAYEALEDCLFLNLNTTTREVDGFGEHTKPLPVRLIP